jgi:hypothetical protein
MKDESCETKPKDERLRLEGLDLLYIADKSQYFQASIVIILTPRLLAYSQFKRAY